MPIPLENALETLEELWEIEPPRGSQNLGPRARFLIVVHRLRDAVCPQLKMARTVLGSEEAALIAVLIDVIGPSASGNIYFVGSLYRAIILLGIERFCGNPEEILK